MPTRTAVANRLNPIATHIAWTGLLLNDDGSWFMPADMADRTVHVSGVFGGATVTMQGSNDFNPAAPDETPTNVFTLTDHTGAPIVFTAAGGRVMAEAPRWIRPLVTGGDGTTALAARVVARA